MSFVPRGIDIGAQGQSYRCRSAPIVGGDQLALGMPWGGLSKVVDLWA